ncbi:MAG: PKD domain-containing protein [bacterium]|nr:PKD domain-containing protein [bacterium]
MKTNLNSRLISLFVPGLKPFVSGSERSFDIPAALERKTETFKLVPSNSSGGDRFGASVSISSDGRTAIAGAHDNADMGKKSGSAYLYRWNGKTWQETILIPSDAPVDNNFGKSVAISSDGKTAVVGAPHDNDKGISSGSVYIYRWNGSAWNETKVSPFDGACGDNFGFSISISAKGNTICIGAPFSSIKGVYSGAAYIFRWNGKTWNESKITPSDGVCGDNFGRSVSLAALGNKLVVGAHYKEDNGCYSGSMYIYLWNGCSWKEQKLTPSDGASGDYFGKSVSISSDGNTVIAGAYGDEDNGCYSGSVYLYSRNDSSWEETKIVPSDGGPGDYFGYSVSLSPQGNTAIVGAYRHNTNGSSTGSAYLFRKNENSWLESKLTPPDGSCGHYFGQSVSLSSDGNTALAGAYGDKNNGPLSGSVYIYRTA